MRVPTRALVAALAVAVLLAACGGRSDTAGAAGAMSARPIEQVLEAHRDSLMALPGVVGVAQGLCDDLPCIRIFATDSSSVARAGIPAQLEGHPVRVEVSGPFRAR